MSILLSHQFSNQMCVSFYFGVLPNILMYGRNSVFTPFRQTSVYYCNYTSSSHRVHLFSICVPSFSHVCSFHPMKSGMSGNWIGESVKLFPFYCNLVALYFDSIFKCTHSDYQIIIFSTGIIT